MIEKVADNKTNLEPLNLNRPEDVKEKLDYYRSLFLKTQDLPDDEFENLKKDVATFFNLKPGGETKKAPERLVRISINQKILGDKPLNYLTDISQLLAPPLDKCTFGRCNLPKHQILYCSTTEAGAYWETKPKHGDVITLTHFKLKEGAEINCNIVVKDKKDNPNTSHPLREVYHLLRDFFVDVYSLEVSRDRPRDYVFSSVLSSETLYYPVIAPNNFEAMYYPSVQKKKFGLNLAIRNELVFKYYDLFGVETRFILDEYENIDPSTEELTTDQVIGSFGTNTFDMAKGKILYDEIEAKKLFDLFRMMQTSEGKQERFEYPDNPEISKNLLFDVSAKVAQKAIKKIKKVGRNDRINVVYRDGSRKDNVKFKFVEEDISVGRCIVSQF